MLALDLGVFSKKNKVVSFKEASIWSLVWISLALGFYLLVDMHGDWIHGIDNFQELDALQDRYAEHVDLVPNDFEKSRQLYRDNMALEFITGYLVEYALSIDNIFVIILIFSSFGVREKYYKKVLFWGIMGALVMRFMFIFLGAALMARFEWILYVFGAFLIFTGGKMFVSKEEEEKIEPAEHPIVKFTSRYFRVFPRFVGPNFFVKKNGKVLLTPLFVTLLIIEFTDLIFAVDSVPAVFAVTKDPYLVFFSNIFAILGLRSMFFFLANIMHLFHHLKTGLSILMIFIGSKMIFHHQLKEWGFHASQSLIVILVILVGSVVASLVFPKPAKKEKLNEIFEDSDGEPDSHVANIDRQG